MKSPLVVVLDSIRFDDCLSPMARIFYGEICSGVSTEGGCPVDDAKFAKLYKKTDRQVRNWRQELIDKNYIYEVVNPVGIKELYPRKFDAEQQVKSLKINRKFDTSYTAPDGRIFRNAEDGLKYFLPLINSSQIPPKFKPNVNKFFLTFLNCLFDYSYYNKCFTQEKFRTSQEFFQFVVQVIKPVDVYINSQKVFFDNFVSIRSLDYYCITVIVNLYKDSFQSTTRRKMLLMKRKSEKERELEEKRLSEIDNKNKMLDERNKAQKELAKKEFKKELAKMTASKDVEI
mgnify:CR=1 FL=1